MFQFNKFRKFRFLVKLQSFCIKYDVHFTQKMYKEYITSCCFIQTPGDGSEQFRTSVQWRTQRNATLLRTRRLVYMSDHHAELRLILTNLTAVLLYFQM